MNMPKKAEMLCRQVINTCLWIFFACFSGVMAVGDVTAFAAETQPLVTAHTQASLVSNIDHIGGQSFIRLGLRLQLKPGWHTYWRNPGDAGDAPHIHIHITGARSGEAEQIEWPVPERISEGGLMSYAYQGDVLLPVRVALRGKETGEALVTARAHWLVCADVCVPESGVFTLHLPVVRSTTDDVGLEGVQPSPVLEEEDAPEAALFHKVDAALPRISPFEAQVNEDGTLQLSGKEITADVVKDAWFLPQESGIIAQNMPQDLHVGAGELSLQLHPDLYNRSPFWQHSLEGVVVLVDDVGNHIALQVKALPQHMLRHGGADVETTEVTAQNGSQPVASTDILLGRKSSDPLLNAQGHVNAAPQVSSAPSALVPDESKVVPTVENKASNVPASSVEAIGKEPSSQQSNSPAPPQKEHVQSGASPREMSFLFKSLLGVLGVILAWWKAHMADLLVKMASAFLGGMILNLMPCVFPVLAMKALSLARMGGASWKARWWSAFFYSFGVMACFVGLGSVMMALRYGGIAAGWGFQFQSTAFVVGIGWVLLLLALNLFGVFEITGGRLLNRMGNVPSNHSRSGDFLTGLLAVIVATPCTAPFMGVAIASALAGPIAAGLLIFVSMGLGLAVPYICIALIPWVARHLPHPGAWMERLKQLLAFPLCASFVWLLWVAVQQYGADAVVIMLGGAVLLGVAGWLYGIAQRRMMRGAGRKLAWMCRIGALVCVGICLAGLVKMSLTRDTASLPAAAHLQSALEQPAIEPFSDERLASLREEGRPVFVDMTASWCVTCVVNEHVALSAPSVRRAFQSRNIIILRGDWTRYDAHITAYLKAHGRDGVPLYVYYPPQGEEHILPQLLTPQVVISAVSSGH